MKKTTTKHSVTFFSVILQLSNIKNDLARMKNNFTVPIINCGNETTAFYSQTKV